MFGINVFYSRSESLSVQFKDIYVIIFLTILFNVNQDFTILFSIEILYIIRFINFIVDDARLIHVWIKDDVNVL